MSTKQDFSSKDSIHFTIPGCEENKWKPLEIVEPPKFLNEKSFFFLCSSYMSVLNKLFYKLF